MLCCLPPADLMHTLWEADVTVFKAHITTNPASDVLDMFWIYDNRHELPDHHRRAIKTCPANCLILSQQEFRPVSFKRI